MHVAELWRYPVKSLRGEQLESVEVGLDGVMTTFDPDTLEQDPSVLRRVVSSFAGSVALDCWVETPGRIAVGDVVEVVSRVGA